nr:hypothetical protein [Ancylomarina sp. DW003]
MSCKLRSGLLIHKLNQFQFHHIFGEGMPIGILFLVALNSFP